MDKIINIATSEINANSQVLKNTLEKESNNDNIERQMLIKYVVSWNELAIAFQENMMFFESIEAFQTAITIYAKLHMKIHHIFACGDYFLSKIHIASKQSSEVDLSDSLLFKDQDMIPAFDFASELNAYPLLTSSVYQMLDGMKVESVSEQIEKAKGLLEKSQRLDPELKDQLI